ncbi:Signal peptidase complex subunit 1 [Cardamine amara subsp. amara]|uniref:Signal peptidase complex subunit 1 n=1 Tax=Cardamine amara subsp. amara TaxID=228776 RepID=A0ABD1ARL3_CARAN
MDWKGQKLSEELMQILLLVFGGVAFITGYATSSFRTMMLIYAGAVLFTTMITVPNWPFFNRHPLKWLDPIQAEKYPKPELTNVISKKKKNKHY